jgi:hypothetical protein
MSFLVFFSFLPLEARMSVLGTVCPPPGHGAGRGHGGIAGST